MGIQAGGGTGVVAPNINVTPLVDVVLVLLIIFLVTMPMMMRQVTVQVPRKVAPDEFVSSNAVSITIKYNENQEFEFVKNGEKVDGLDNLNAVIAKLHEILDPLQTEKLVFVDFADNIQFKQVMKILDAIKGVGKVVKGREKERVRDVKVAIKTREKDKSGAPTQ